MRFLAGFVLCIALVLSWSRTAHACGLLDLVCKANSAIDSWIENKGAAAGAGVAEGFRPLINQVMAEQLPALINDINAAVHNNIITAQAAGDELVDHINRALDDAFEQAGQFREQLVAEMTTFRDKMFQQLNASLDRTFYNAHCLVAVDFTKRINDYISSDLAKLAFWQRNHVEETCRKELHLPKNIKQNDPKAPLQSYSLAKCVMEDTQDLSTPSSTLSNEYGDLQQNASDLMCAVQYAPAAREIALQYWIDAGRATNTWYLASIRQ